MDSSIKVAITITVFLGIAVAIVPFTGCYEGYSEGERTGQVTKLSHKGIFFKTWEGEMNLGGLTRDSNGNPNANVWQFSVSNEDVVKKVQDAQRSGNRVTLKYVEWIKSPISKGSSDYFIVDVK